MKLPLIFGILLLSLVNNHLKSQDLSVRLQIINKDSCYKICYEAELWIVNLSNEDYYIMPFSRNDLIVKNGLGINISKRFYKREFDFIRKNSKFVSSNKSWQLRDSIFLLKNNQKKHLIELWDSRMFWDFVNTATQQSLIQLSQINGIVLDSNEMETESLIAQTTYKNAMLIKANDSVCYTWYINTLMKRSKNFVLKYNYKPMTQTTNTLYWSKTSNGRKVKRSKNPISHIHGFTWYNFEIESNRIKTSALKKIKIKPYL